MWAVIGGSGFEKFSEVEKVRDLDRETPFGMASSGLKLVRVRAGKNDAPIECIFLPRHGERHELLPSEVNFAANIFALKRAGARKIMAFSAVGSLREELAPGDMVVPTQYIDRTKSLRRSSFCGNGVVGHVSLAHPTWKAAGDYLRRFAKDFAFKIHFDRVALVVEGPYFSTQAESHSFRALGCDIIGMTAFPEYALAREAGMGFVPCSFVTDYDCWNDKIAHVTLDEVIQTMHKNNGKAFQVLQLLLASPLEQDELAHEGSLRTGLMTPWENVAKDQQAWLEVLRA